MADTFAEVTAVSTKGQVVLPKTIRDMLALVPGTKLMVFSDGDNILMKPIKNPEIAEFSRLMDQAQKWAQSVDMKESDITEAIKAVRKNRRAVK